MPKQKAFNQIEYHSGPGNRSSKKSSDPPESADPYLRFDEQSLENLHLTYDDLVDSVTEMVDGDFYKDDTELWFDDDLLMKIDLPPDSELPYV